MRKFVAAAAAVALTISLTPSTQAADPAPAKQAAITRDQMVKFVEEAAAYVEKAGKDAALKEFSDPKGSFVRDNGELYIYAYDFKCVCLAHGFTPNLVGKDLTEHKDAKGLLVIRKLRDTVARDGKGFVDFYWVNPATGKEEPKVGYVVKADEDFWLGSGIYSDTK